MKALKERILRDGKCFEGGILKVDNFINHQMDPILMKSIAVEFVRRFASTNINKVMTIEASGIAPAIMVGYLLELPVVFAKKKKPVTMENMLTTSVYSFTKDRSYDVCVSKDFLSKGDRVLFIDDFLANGNAAKGIIDLVEKAGAELSGMGFIIKISVIYNGMDDTGITLQERKSRTPEILFVGRISREKGVICLLNALNKVASRGYFCKLKLVGQCTGYMSSHIRKAYKQLKIDILGTVSFNELKELYTTNTIGVIPSLHEQCSYVAIEMSMFGMPMIVSDVDALSEMFEDEVNALRIPLVFDEDFGLELDEEKLADAIIRLIDDEALRLKLSTNAIKNYQERFTLEKMIENTINVYEQLIEQDNA